MDALPAVRWNIPHVWNRGILPKGSRLLRKQWDFELVAEELDVFEFTGCLVPEEECRAVRGLDGTNISCENSNCGITPPRQDSESSATCSGCVGNTKRRQTGNATSILL